jgi:hypothetical protein
MWALLGTLTEYTNPHPMHCTIIRTIVFETNETDADAGSTWVPDRGGLKAFTLFPLLRMPLTLHQLTSKETAVEERNVFYFWVDQQLRLELD